MGELGESTSRLSHRVLVPGDGSVVVVLDGELDIATTHELSRAVKEAVASVRTCLVIDAARLQFADSSALALWVKWSYEVPKIEIRNPQPMVRRVIETMGLTEILNPS